MDRGNVRSRLPVEREQIGNLAQIYCLAKEERRHFWHQVLISGEQDSATRDTIIREIKVLLEIEDVRQRILDSKVKPAEMTDTELILSKLSTTNLLCLICIGLRNEMIDNLDNQRFPHMMDLFRKNARSEIRLPQRVNLNDVSGRIARRFKIALLDSLN